MYDFLHCQLFYNHNFNQFKFYKSVFILYQILSNFINLIYLRLLSIKKILNTSEIFVSSLNYDNFVKFINRFIATSQFEIVIEMIGRNKSVNIVTDEINDIMIV